jgi:secreted trypsin-like serine protease
MFKGDSGSGLIGNVLDKTKNKDLFFQHGIVSIGVDCSRSEPFPGIYTRVSKYIKWILDNMSQ